jgi:predicted RNA polymerase sigma factor
LINKRIIAEATLHAIKESSHLKEWDKNYLYHSLLGELYAATDKTKAVESYEKAIHLTQSNAEKRLLQKKINLLYD